MKLRSGKLGIRACRLAPVCLGLLAAGCGGGSGGNSTLSTQTANVGPVAVSFSGHPHPAVTNVSGQVSTFGQAGASYSSLSMNPAPSLASTFLLFTRQFGSSI